MVHMVAMILHAYAYAYAYDYVHAFAYYNPCAGNVTCLVDIHLNPNAKSIDDSYAIADRKHRHHMHRICIGTSTISTASIIFTIGTASTP